MTIDERKKVTSALRKALQILEAGEDTPLAKKERKQPRPLKRQFEEQFASGTWGKPDAIKKTFNR